MQLSDAEVVQEAYHVQMHVGTERSLSIRGVLCALCMSVVHHSMQSMCLRSMVFWTACACSPEDHGLQISAVHVYMDCASCQSMMCWTASMDCTCLQSMVFWTACACSPENHGLQIPAVHVFNGLRILSVHDVLDCKHGLHIYAESVR